MKTTDVKVTISEHILKCMKDQSAANVLRDILFAEYNNIDWRLAGLSLITHMPELEKI